jgi:hypothetical protein
MLAGELYDPLAPELVRARDRARDLCQDLNATREADQQARRRILKELFGQGGESVCEKASPTGRAGAGTAPRSKVAIHHTGLRRPASRLAAQATR